MPRLADLMRDGEFAKGLDTPSGNPFGRWAQGVAQRTMHPLETLGNEAQRWIDMPAEQMLTEVGDRINPVAGGLVGMFAGKGAKTANLAMLAKAEDLAKKGVPDEVIWKETGWTLGFPDKKPRFEIPDNAAKGIQPNYSESELLKMKINDNKVIDNIFPMSKHLNHDELYKNYPDIKNINTLIGGVGDNAGLYFDNNGISQINLYDRPIISDKAKSTTLHELQHAIQQREGFARGGSPTDAVNLRDEILPTIQNLQSRINDIRTGKVQGSFDELMQLENELKPLNQQYDVLARENAFDTYKRLAGEAEARLTQARMNMTPEQRLANYPVSQFDVPVSDQIVRYGDDVSNSTIHPFDGERHAYAARQANGKWKPIYSDGTPIDRAPDFNDGAAATYWLKKNAGDFRKVGDDVAMSAPRENSYQKLMRERSEQKAINTEFRNMLDNKEYQAAFDKTYGNSRLQIAEQIAKDNGFEVVNTHKGVGAVNGGGYGSVYMQHPDGRRLRISDHSSLTQRSQEFGGASIVNPSSLRDIYSTILDGVPLSGLAK